MESEDMKRYVVAITGASGSIYAISLLRGLVSAGTEIAVTMSREGRMIMAEEVGIDTVGKSDAEAAAVLTKATGAPSGTLTFHNEDDLHAPISSGSHPVDGMFVVPCSMKTLAAIANGYADTLIERSADVALKERRPLVIVPRETPLSAIHLENMLKLSRLGVHILAAMPGFYGGPKTIQELADSIAGRALDLMGITNDIYPRWRG